MYVSVVTVYPCSVHTDYISTGTYDHPGIGFGCYAVGFSLVNVMSTF